MGNGGRTFELRERLSRAYENAAKFVADCVAEDGSLRSVEDGLPIDDLAAYYKTTSALLMSGRRADAVKVMKYVQMRFASPDGDFVTGGETGKTANEALKLYDPYINGWLALGALRLELDELRVQATQWLAKFRHPALGGSLLKPYSSGDGDGSNSVDMLLTAHLGLLSLETDDMEAAVKAGECLLTHLGAQEDVNGKLGQSVFLRLDDSSMSVEEDYPAELEPFYVVDSRKPNQLYFMVGYPMAYLCKLHAATQDQRFLQGAIQLAEFCLTCHESMYSFHFAHKIAWAAACLWEITGDCRYIQMSIRVAESLLDAQDADTGAFLPGEPLHDSIDQTAEVSMWLREVYRILEHAPQQDSGNDAICKLEYRSMVQQATS